MDPAWVTASIALATLIGGIAIWAGRWVWKVTSRTTRFMDDYFGEPAGPGRAARPGVMERLANLEMVIGDVSTQVHLNSGHSMRDTVQSTEQIVREMRSDLADLHSAVERLGGKK